MKEEYEEQSLAKNYRLKELKVYSSTEWLANNKKKYRQVFDRYHTSYVYAELSIINKLFDVESWEVEVQLKCFRQEPKLKEVCALNISRKVGKHEHISYIREGWGNKKDGVFWKKGSYYWEAYIYGELIASKYFYIEDRGEDGIEAGDPYLELKSLKTYEGKYDDVNEDDRKYHVVFSGEQARYIYLEAKMRNLNPLEKWQFEIFVKFYNEARELKGQVTRLQKIEEGQDEISITAGWGSNIKGSWRYGAYSCEITFMDNLLATIPFEVDDDFEEGYPEVYLPGAPSGRVLIGEEEDELSFDEIMTKLNSMIGLQRIKKQIKDQAKYIQFIQLRKERGFEEKEPINVNSVFIGNPGTGKTTIAKMMGRIYKEMGLLSRGHVLDVDRSDLVGEYIGQTAPKVKDVIDRARGGVLFIDEAYSLSRSSDDSKDFGKEVIELLVKEMSSDQGDMVVVVAGYPKEMKIFLNSNPGLKSRFKLFYEFPDYFPNELSDISKYACIEKEVNLSEEAEEKANSIIVREFRKRDRSFGNARFVFDLVEKAKQNLALRIMNKEAPEASTIEQLKTIIENDVQEINPNSKSRKLLLPIDYELLDASMAELDALIGLDSVKKEIKEIVELVKFYIESEKDVINNFFLHSIFVGNPGTGKTTIARILTRIYKALGVLERGHMIETDRQGLVAGYVGQTAIKTSEKIDEAIGGVLFIDEAYALNNKGSNQGDFGNEAIQILLKRMEDQRGAFFVFAAGYPDNMESFLKMNPGLSSRFDKTFRFEDYSATELFQIGEKMLEEKSMRLTVDAKEQFQNYLEFLHSLRDKYFGNARVVRNVVTDLIKYQNLRLAAMEEADREGIELDLVTTEDVKQFELDKDKMVFTRSTIGFKRSESSGQ